MKNIDRPESRKESFKPHLYIGPDNLSTSDVLEDRITGMKNLEEQAEIELFWAGRNLAKRNSTRWAA